MSVYDRPMFKKGGGAIGIMASGPELMKRFSNGGFNFIPSAGANPILTGARDPMIANFVPGDQINQRAVKVDETPLEGFARSGVREIGKPMPQGVLTIKDVRNILDPEITEKAKKEERKKEISELEKKASLTVDDIKKENTSKDINKTNEEILKKETKTEDKKEKSSDDIKKENTNTLNILKKFYKTDEKALGLETDQEVQAAKQAVINAGNKVAEGVADFKDQEFVGGSFNTNLKELDTALRKEGKEITLEDVYDEGIKLLGYDPRELDKNFNADRRQAFFMNLIKAGLYTAAGGSKDAVSNVALGLAKGLEGFGADVGELRDDLREDRTRASTVMYNLLKSEKSEQLAKEALDLDKKFKIFNISKMQVDQKREEALRVINADYEKKKFNLNYLIELKKFDQKERLSDKQLKTSLMNSIMDLKSISVPFMRGMVEPAEGYTREDMDITNPATWNFTQDGLELSRKIAENVRSYRPSNYQSMKIDGTGKSIVADGIVYEDPSKNDGTIYANWNTADKNRYVKAINDSNFSLAGSLLLQAVQEDPNAKIDLNKVTNPAVIEYFRSNEKDEDENEIPGSSPLAKNPTKFIDIIAADLSTKKGN